MSKITITIDNHKHSLESGITAKEITKELKLDKRILAAKFNDELIDLAAKLAKDGILSFVTFDSPEGKEIFRHSSAHILAQAVTSLYPEALPTIGPAVEEGFYYDFDLDKTFAPEDLAKIEKKMKDIIKQNLKIEREQIPKNEALKLFKNNKYKQEMIEELDEPTITVYQQGEYAEFCRGPHVPSTGYIGAVKLTKIAGAYWKGDNKNKMLQRLYGISFPSQQELDDHVKRIEEAEKRDHRKLGKQLDLFSMHDEGPGFPFFHPSGMVIINQLKQFWREEHAKAGYDEIQTPIILSRTLWEQSGHWDHYKNSMYFTKIDGLDFAVKPMNCPGGILVYKEHLHSYKELPMRLAEMGIVHRHELSGVLAGLFRVRTFTQDDAHIFMTEEQIREEIIGVINLVDKFYKTFNFDYQVELSTRPKDKMGTDAMWEVAEKGLEEALKTRKMNYKINPGDGAFYGPKIDFHIKDCIGRTWQCATIQLDFQMPEKFDLTYEGQDGKKHRPVMIHRVIYGAIERFLGILIENYAGKFPLWLSPVQIRIMTVSEKFNDHAEELRKKLLEQGYRVELDVRSESIPKKVRDAQAMKIPLMLTIGEKEVSNNTVAIRTADGKVYFGMQVEEFIRKAADNIAKRENAITF
ncbi:MAG: threonine--tRNA ligase [Candidatus Woesearchaeota archaeon]